MSEEQKSVDEEVITLNVRDMYDYDPKKVKAKIVSTHYSNQAWIQINHRDVVLDFLQIPGYPENDSITVPAARIYLTHSHAQKMANLILNILKDLDKKDRLEKYESEDG